MRKVRKTRKNDPPVTQNLELSYPKSDKLLPRAAFLYPTRLIRNQQVSGSTGTPGFRLLAQQKPRTMRGFVAFGEMRLCLS